MMPHLTQKSPCGGFQDPNDLSKYSSARICAGAHTRACTCTHTPLASPLLLSPSHTPAILVRLLLLTIPSMFPSYGLCLHCSFCLKHSSLRYPLNLLPQPSLCLCSNVTSRRLTPCSLSKIETCCFPSTLLVPLLMFCFPLACIFSFICCYIYQILSVSPGRE